MTVPRPTQTKTKKGMLVIIPQKGKKQEIKFQYNPQTFKIGLKSQTYSSSGGRQPTAGPPAQSMSLSIQLEASRMDPEDRHKKGIRPQLAQLEMLLYPSLADVKKNKSLLGQGKIEAVPLLSPTVLFVYGNRGAIPVRLTGIDVEEQLHDSQLNPMMAQVTLQMEAVTYGEVPPSDANYGKAIAYHQGLEKAADS